jgi:hypothetical protein
MLLDLFILITASLLEIGTKKEKCTKGSYAVPKQKKVKVLTHRSKSFY